MNVNEADGELAFDIGKHCSIEAMRAMQEGIDQRMKALHRRELRVAAMIVALAYVGATLAGFRKVADPHELEMLDEM